ncbi:hypothetical protein [Polaromonas hydrogenivorans]|uniref:Uncharacterized protein n=1 Tax=Polaromonas hydrogenivorans TaxID=335476 RepID=A0AAU7LSD1_9BURK
MFKVTIIKNIWDSQSPVDSARFAALERRQELPFAPYPGLELFWGLERPHRVVNVRWEIQNTIFVCKVEDEFPNELDVDGLDFDELVEAAQLNDWALLKVYEPK